MDKETKIIYAKTFVINLIIEFVNEKLDGDNNMEMKQIMYKLMEKIYAINL